MLQLSFVIFVILKMHYLSATHAIFNLVHLHTDNKNDNDYINEGETLSLSHTHTHTHTHMHSVAAKTIELQGLWHVVLLCDMCEMVN